MQHTDREDGIEALGFKGKRSDVCLCDPHIRSVYKILICSFDGITQVDTNDISSPPAYNIRISTRSNACVKYKLAPKIAWSKPSLLYKLLFR